jgi:hypothetical protein
MISGLHTSSRMRKIISVKTQGVIKMTESQRLEMRAELELKTGWSQKFIDSRTDEELKKLHKERVGDRG